MTTQTHTATVIRHNAHGKPYAITVTLYLTDCLPVAEVSRQPINRKTWLPWQAKKLLAHFQGERAHEKALWCWTKRSAAFHNAT